MHLISSILFGLSANADSFVIGVSYGLKKVHIPFIVNLAVSFVTFIGTLLSIGLGDKIGGLIPQRAAQSIGCSVLILMGLYYLIAFMLKKEPPKLQAADVESDAPLTLSWKEAMSLGFALTLNNAGMGVGASITGIPLIPTSLISFLFSIIFLYCGNRLGKSSLLFRLSRFAEPVSGIIIIVLGVYELLI